MKIYNTLTKKEEEFVPRKKDEVTLYTCGPTVYNYQHIGNLRTYIFNDILEKTLRYIGYNVKRAMNITDVGHIVGDADSGKDKMIAAKEREHKTALEIAKFYTDIFKNDCAKLNIKWPDIVKNATGEIDTYIKIITKLLKDEYAYESNGNIYFDISKMPNYYELSGKNPEELMVAIRDDVDVDQNKKNPFDFVLWFTSSKFRDQELQWDSPFGRGYPGWHIECSAIAINYLGEYLDIHTGGVDHIFPHHTNEIAQSEAYLGHKWCNYFMHGEFLNDTTGKMSKSKGEFLILDTLIKRGYNPLAYRFFCLQSHYRKQLAFSYESLDTASLAYIKLKSRIKNLVNDDSSLDNKKIEYYKNIFKESLEDDLNTANALTCLMDVIKDTDINDKTKLFLIEDFDKALSLGLLDKEDVSLSLDEIKEIEDLVKERDIAKRDKDYNKADEIRELLNKKGIIIKDSKDGTIWEIKGGN
jgi:cysteinyl-tRNA synthetase